MEKDHTKSTKFVTVEGIGMKTKESSFTAECALRRTSFAQDRWRGDKGYLLKIWLFRQI